MARYSTETGSSVIAVVPSVVSLSMVPVPDNAMVTTRKYLGAGQGDRESLEAASNELSRYPRPAP